jgi:hypothetical protein
MDIAQYFKEVAVLLHKYSLVSAAKQLPVFPVMPVEALGINPIYMTHATGDIAVRSLNQQVVMVGHQAIGRHPEIPSLRRFLKNFYECLIVMTGQKDVLSPPATVHDMIPSSRIFYAQRSRHNKLITNCSLKVNSRLDPIFIQPLQERFSRPGSLPDNATPVEKMRHYLKTSEGKQLYDI